MAQTEKTESLAFPTTNPQTRIATFFDSAELIVERTERLVMKAKYLIFGLTFLLFLIYEMIRFGTFLLSGR